MSAYAQPAALLTCAVVTTADFTVGKGATFKTDSVTKPSASAFFFLIHLSSYGPVFILVSSVFDFNFELAEMFKFFCCSLQRKLFKIAIMSVNAFTVQ
jgi:hypothetical protein